jgi:hypothetical protein
VRFEIKKISAVVLLAATLFVAPGLSRAYEPQFADNAGRVPLRWKNGVVTLALSNSLKQAANIKAGSDIPGAIDRSLKTWESAANIKFNTIWTDRQSISAAEGKGDGVSLLTIASTPENVAPFSGSGAELAGRTRIFYTKRGLVTEADIVLNPFQQFSTDGTIGTYDLQATITHEIGHLLGLEHSSVLGATMHPQQGRNGTFSLPGFSPRTLAEDDRVGIRSLYGTKTENCCGTISGTLSSPGGKPLANLNVWIEDPSGRIIANAITSASGALNIAGLRAGRYSVLAQSEKSSVAEIGEVVVENGATASLNRTLNLPGKTFDLRLVGFNSQLSTIAVPLNAGRSYLIFLGDTQTRFFNE